MSLACSSNFTCLFVLAAALSDSQRSSRSSLITRFSRMSLASSASTPSQESTLPQPQPSSTSVGRLSCAQESDDSSYEYSSPALNARDPGNDASYPLLGLTSPSASTQVAGYDLAEVPRAAHPVSTHLPVGATFLSTNPAFPCPQAGHTPLANNICYACNTSCRNAATLARHQNEFCERKVEWVCPACPHRVFGLQERLNRHHMEAHAESCPYGCDKRERLHLEACKTQLSTCSRPITTKKAWGCPCCIKCFESLEEWSRHILDHPVQNDKVLNWSFSTMVWSLLTQPYLANHMTWEHWQCCTWSTLSKEVMQSLRYALERQEVPGAVLAQPDYCGLDGPAALAKYAFNLGTIGKPHSRERRTPKLGETSFYFSPSNGSADSPQYRNPVGLTANSPADWPSRAEEAMLTYSVTDESEAPSSFRERVSGHANTRLRQSRGTGTERGIREIVMPEDSCHLGISTSNGEPRHRPVNGSENRHVPKLNTSSPQYGIYPPMVRHDGPAPSPAYTSEHSEPTMLAIQPHYPDHSDSRRLQTKKSQANLHGRFAHTGVPPLPGDEAPALPIPWPDAQPFGLEHNARGLNFDQPAPQRPQTASSRPATPARSENSQGSWTRFLNTSPPLPGARYSVAMSLSGPPSGPPSDIDMA